MSHPKLTLLSQCSVGLAVANKNVKGTSQRQITHIKTSPSFLHFKEVPVSDTSLTLSMVIDQSSSLMNLS